MKKVQSQGIEKLINEAEKRFAEHHEGNKANSIVLSVDGMAMLMDIVGIDPTHEILQYKHMIVSVCYSPRFPLFKLGILGE